MRGWKIITVIFICAFTQNFGVNAQIISTIAGSGTWFGGGGAFTGDGGPATDAQFFQPISVTIDSSGNIYVADKYNFRIRKINTDGIINTIAGTGVSSYGGDDSIATIAKLCDLGYIKIGNDGNLYIPDICNNRIRKVNLTSGIITTIAGTGSFFCSWDTGMATAATINYPFSVAYDNTNNIYLSDACDYIDKINPGGHISRFAGLDSADGFGGDGGPAIDARFNHPVDMAFDLYGNLFISDLANDVIRKIDTFGVITKFAGTDTVWGYYGDDGLATLAKFNYPEGIVTDGAGNVFFSDELNDVVRRIDHATRIITTIAGNNTYGYSGDGLPATDAQLGHPTGLAFDRYGNLYIADWYNNRIRKVTNAGVPVGVQRNSAEKQEVSVYPNPVTNWVNIERVNGDDIRVLDILGRLLDRLTMTATKNTVVMDVSTLQKGMYFVEIVNNETGIKVVKKVQKE